MWRDRVAGIPLWGWALLVGCVSLGLRLPAVGQLSMWVDDGASLESIQLGIREQFFERLAAGHIPWYFLFLNVWESIFGDSIWSIRAPSLIFAMACLPAVAIVAHRLSGARGAVAAMVLFAVHGTLIRHSAELRPYSLFAAEAAWWLAIWTLVREKPGPIRWLALGFCHLALLQTHASAIFWTLPMYAMATVDLWMAKVDRRVWPVFAASFLVPVILTVPMVLLIVSFLRGKEYNKFEREVPFDELLLSIFEQVLSLGTGGRGIELWLGLALVALACVCLANAKATDAAGRRLIVLCGVAAIAAPVLAYLVSVTIKPVFGPARYYITGTGAVLALLGAAVGEWDRPRSRAAWIARLAFLICFVAGVDRAQSRIREVITGDGVGLNTAIAGIEASAPDGAVVYITDAGTTPTIFSYYVRHSAKKFRVVPVSVRLSDSEMEQLVRSTLREDEDAFVLLYRSERDDVDAGNLRRVIVERMGPWGNVTRSAKKEPCWEHYSRTPSPEGTD